MSHNADLKKLLSSMNSQLEKASTSEDIFSIVQMAIDFDGEIKFNHKPILVFFGVALLVAVWSVSTLFWGDASSGYLPVVIGVSSVSAIVSGGIVFFERSLISDLSRKIFESKLMIDNHMKLAEVTPIDTFSLQYDFTEFDRGNHSRHFENFWMIEQSEDSVPAIYYKFHYVDKRTRTVTESDGKGGYRSKEETYYVHNDRYGLIFDFPYAQGLSINSNGTTKNPVNYKPSYGEFLKQFSIGANTELEAAKFLKPALLEAIVKLSADFSRLNIQILNNKMLLAFSECMLGEMKTKYSLASPTDFLDELKSKTVFDNIKSANELIRIFTRHLDDNFSN